MIVWINGTFGVGKTTTCQAILDSTDWRLFDPEHVGFLLMDNLKDVEFDDFQDLPPWRALVPAVAQEIVELTKPTAMLMPQTVFVETYWQELMQAFAERSMPVFHVALDCDEDELRRRIETDEVESQARQWRLDHIARFTEARPWLTEAADLVLDTTSMTAKEAAATIIGAAAPPSSEPESE